MTKRAILYARVSSDDRRYMTSGIDNQLADCRHYATNKGYEVVGEFYEERDRLTSGADWLPEIERILELAEQRAFDVLIVRELDRLARDRVKHVLIKHYLENCDVMIEYVIGQFANTDEGEFQEGVMREFAHYQRKQLTRKLHRGIRDHVKKGNIKTGGCASPYGYDLCKIDGRWALVVNEQEAATVRLIFDMWVNQGRSVHIITKYLDEHHIPKPLKGKAHKANEIAALKLGWSRGTVSAILGNEVYVGRWYYRKTKAIKNPVTGKKKHVPRPKEEWILVNVSPIIDEELYQAAQGRGQKNKHLMGKQHKHVYAVGGMTTCGRCGHSMSGVTRGGKTPPRYGYYACNIRLQKKLYGRTCDNPYFRVDAVDTKVWEWVKGVLLDPARLIEGLNKYQDAQRAGLRPFYNLLESNEKGLAALKAEKERLIKAYSAGVLSLDEIAVQKTELDKRINELTHATAQLRAELEPRILSKLDIERIEDLAAQVRDRADLGDGEPERQREIYKLIDMRVTLDEIEGTQFAQVHCILGQPYLSTNAGTDSYINRSRTHARPTSFGACLVR